jgi:hypothetical protein
MSTSIFVEHFEILGGCLMQTSPSQFYPLKHKNPYNSPSYKTLDSDILAHQKARQKRMDINKFFLREHIENLNCPSYLEYNAQTRGDLEKQNEIFDLHYQENLKNVCGKSVVWFQGQNSESYYQKKIDCRKHWCPVCGGKGGKIHDSRLHAILNRADFNKYNLRQFVFTVPASIRDLLANREDLSKVIKSLKSVIEHFFGEPQFDRRGDIKRYKLNKGVIFYFHAFGDEVPGIYKPHFNIHVFENRTVKLKLEVAELELIKKCWLKELKKLDENIDVVDVHYCFRNNIKKNIHSVKYMAKPYGVGDWEMIEDEKLKYFLAVEMKGFQYLRFWGSMANCKYEDEMELPEVVKEVESQVGEKLIPLFIAPYDEAAWADKVDDLGNGLYRVKKKDCQKYIDEQMRKKVAGEV